MPLTLLAGCSQEPTQQASEPTTTRIGESVADVDVARVLRQYAEQDYDVIIGHSYNHQDAVFQVADYDQPFYQGAYIVGLLAGKLSKTGKLGAVYEFLLMLPYVLTLLVLLKRTHRSDVPTALGIPYVKGKR